MSSKSKEWVKGHTKKRKNLTEYLPLLTVVATSRKHGFKALNIDGYYYYRRDAKGFPLHTGIGVYVHDDIRHYVKRREDLETENIECIWLELRPYALCPLS